MEWSRMQLGHSGMRQLSGYLLRNTVPAEVGDVLVGVVQATGLTGLHNVYNITLKLYKIIEERHPLSGGGSLGTRRMLASCCQRS